MAIVGTYVYRVDGWKIVQQVVKSLVIVSKTNMLPLPADMNYPYGIFIK